jgi:hypothetical protein
MPSGCRGTRTAGQSDQDFSEQQGVAGACGGPLRQTLQLDAADGALQFGEAEIGAEALVQPAEAGVMFAPEDRLVGFAVVFEGPHCIPEVGAMGGHHAAFAGGGEDLVLAKAPGGHVTEVADALAADASAMSLGAIFDYGDAVSAGQLEDRGHVGGPTAEVHHGYGLGAGGDLRRDRGGGDGAGFGIHIRKHRLGAEQHGTGGSGDEGTRRGDQLVAGPETNGQVGSREGEGAIGHGDGVGDAAPLGELLLKGGCFLAGPGLRPCRRRAHGWRR